MLTVLAQQLNAHTLIESEDGAVLAHALGPGQAPGEYVDAVLRRTASCLTSALVRRQSVGVGAGAPVVTATIEGWPGTVCGAAVRRGGVRDGWLWLVPADGGIDLPAVVRAATEVSHALGDPAVGHGQDPFVRALLGDAPLPRYAVGSAAAVWVATVIPSASETPSSDPQALASALARNRTQEVVRCVAAGNAVRLIGLVARRWSRHDVSASLQDMLLRSSVQMGVGLRAGLSEPCVVDEPLTRQVRQADVAAVLAADGRVTSVADVRARAVLNLLTPSLSSLPDLGPDPVQALSDLDERRGGDYGASLLAWLDAHGDYSRAADRLAVHANTIRYRIRRLRALGIDLDDPDARLELHMRLRAAARGNPVDGEAPTLIPSPRPAPTAATGGSSAPRLTALP